MRGISVWLGVAVAMRLAVPPSAWPEAALTVEEAVAEALAHHPSLTAAAARLEQADAAHRAVWETYVPRVSGYSGLQYNDVSGTTLTTTPGGPLGGGGTVTQGFRETDTRFIAGATVEEFLFDFGGFSGQRRSTEASRRASMNALESKRLDVALRVQVAYYDLLRAHRLLRYDRETVDRRSARAQQIAALAREGRRERKDLLQAELDLARARLNLTRAQGKVSDLEASFLEAVGQPTRSSRKLVDDVALKAVRLSLEQATERALELRPELAQARAAVEAREAAVDAVEGSFLPRVSAFADVASVTPTGSSDLDQLTVVTGGVTFTVPVDRAFTRARLDRSRAALAELEAREVDVRRQVILDVSRRYTALFEAVERIRITRDLAEQALANFRETRTRYRKGRAPILESTDAYSFLYDARVSLIQALYDAKIAEARLERAIGASLEP